MTGLPLKIVQPPENQARIEAAREWLQHYKDATKKSLKAIAQALDYNQTTISLFLAGKYKGDELGLAVVIEAFRDLEERRAVAPRVPEYVETSFATEVKAVLEWCHINKKLGLVYSGAGRGKTMAIENYLKSHPDCILITADPCLRSPHPLLEELMDALGKTGGSNTRKMRRIVLESLRDSGRMVIVDEAQHLTAKGIDALRILIVDQTHCGLVLVGNEFVFDRMTGSGRGRAEFAQLYSRVGIRRCLQRPIPREDVQTIVESVMTVSADCLDYLHQQAQGHGGFRTVVNLFMMGCDIAAANGKRALDVESLQFAQRFLLIEES